MKKLVLVLLAILFAGTQLSYAKESQQSDADLKKVYELFAQNDLEGAYNLVNKFLADYPKTSDGYVLRAQIYNRQNMSREALVDLNRALEYYRANEDGYLKYQIYWWRADVYRNAQEYDAAIADYTVAYKLAKKQAPAKISGILGQCAELYAIKNDYKNELKTYVLMLKHNKNDQRAMAGFARLMLFDNAYKEVVEVSNTSESIDPTYEEIYRFRMQAYSKLGKKEAAVDDAIKYLYTSKNPILYLVNDIFAQHPRYALACVSELCNMNESNITWKRLQIQLYEANFDYVSAIKKYNQLEREQGSVFYIYEGRSACYDAIGNLYAAIYEISLCINYAEKSEVAGLLAQRAQYYFSAGLYDEAIEDLDKAIDMMPMNGVLYELRGWCYQLKKDYNAAMKDYNTSIDVDKTNASVWVKRAMLHNKLGHAAAAKSDFEYVLEIDKTPNYGSVRHYALFFARNERNAALDWANKIIAIQPENAGLYYDKACLHSLMKNTDAAIATLRTALEKGYRAFAHIENDEDMENIKNHKDFVALLEEYKAKPIVVNDTYVAPTPNDEIPDHFEIPMKKSGGVYEVACQINGIPMNVIFDTGAADICLSLAEAQFMLKNGYLTDADIKGTTRHSIANGDVVGGTRVILREIRVGAAVLRDVEASVIHSQNAPLLLGQSALERFGTVTIDNANSKIIIRK